MATLGIIGASTVQAAYEVFFVLLPVIVWVLVLLSFGEGDERVGQLVAWPFAGLALFSAILRDGISAFDRATSKDKTQQSMVVLAGLIGVILTSTLLTMGILVSVHKISRLWSFYYSVVNCLVVFGVVLMLVVKSILIQRKVYNRYV